MLSIHSNIEHGKFDTDKVGGSGLRESIASIRPVENDLNPSLKIVGEYLCTVMDIHAGSRG